MLITIALNELNLKSAACRLGRAVRVAQDLGLHTEPTVAPTSYIEAEMRRRTAVGHLHPGPVPLTRDRAAMLIDDADCDTALPAALDDHHMSDRGHRLPDGAEGLTPLPPGHRQRRAQLHGAFPRAGLPRHRARPPRNLQPALGALLARLRRRPAAPPAPHRHAQRSSTR